MEIAFRGEQHFCLCSGLGSPERYLRLPEHRGWGEALPPGLFFSGLPLLARPKFTPLPQAHPFKRQAAPAHTGLSLVAVTILQCSQGAFENLGLGCAGGSRGPELRQLSLLGLSGTGWSNR